MLSEGCLFVLSVTLVYCGQTVGWIKMKLAVFTWLTSVTDRQTNRPKTDRPRYSVGNNRPHLRT